MFKPLGGSLTQDVVLLTGKWAFIDDGGAIDTTKHAGFSVAAADGNGKQVITLEDTYNSLVGVSLTYHDGSVYDAERATVCEVESETVASTKEITIQHVAVKLAGPQTQGRLENKVVRVMIWLKNSGV